MKKLKEFEKNSRNLKKTQGIFQKTQGNFQKTQDIANFLLELVAGKCPKKMPELKLMQFYKTTK